MREKGKREAALWHFKDLARANEATEATVSYVDTAFREHMLSALTPESSVTLLHGIQRVAKLRVSEGSSQFGQIQAPLT